MQYIVIGTEIKINVHVLPIDGMSMESYNFDCEFYTYSNKKLKVQKSEMIKVDGDNYIATIDTSVIGVGALRNRIIAQVPDMDFIDGYRTEIADVNTDVVIIR